MQCHRVSGGKSFPAAVDGKGPLWCWRWKTPARRPRRVVPCGADSKPSGSIRHRDTLHRSLPITKGALFSLCQRSGQKRQAMRANRVPLLHTLRMHKKDMELATEEARRSPLSPSRGSPQQTPERSRALAAARQRRPNASATPGPAPGASGASARQTAGAVRHTVSPADPIS